MKAVKAVRTLLAGLLGYPRPVQAWVMLLGTVNMAVPLFFLDRPEAQLTLAALAAGFTLQVILTHRTGFTRLLGLGHVFWLPLVTYMVLRLPAHPPEALYGLWMRALVAVNSISLVVDTVDVVRYARGERAELVGPRS